MLRLIVVLLLIGLLMTILLRGRDGAEDGAAGPYQEQRDRAREVEQQLQESLEQRRQQVDETSG